MNLPKPLQQTLLALYGAINPEKTLEYPGLNKLFISSYFLYKRWEDPCRTLTARYPDLFTNGHILDVGANIGYTALVFADRLSPGCQVYAFEPEETNYRRLQDVVQKKGESSLVIPVRAAAGAISGEINLWKNPTHPGDHRVLTTVFQADESPNKVVERVPLVALDDFCRSRHLDLISFIKIDVQGFETEVCKGMSETLEHNPRATVLLEYFPEAMESLGFNPHDVLEFFAQRGYAMYRCKRRAPLQRLNINQVDEETVKIGYTDLLFTKQKIAS